MTTFEDSEKESEYGYVRKVNQSFSFPLFIIHCDTVSSLRFVFIVLLIDRSLRTVLCILNFAYSTIDSSITSFRLCFGLRITICIVQF